MMMTPRKEQHQKRAKKQQEGQWSLFSIAAKLLTTKVRVAHLDFVTSSHTTSAGHLTGIYFEVFDKKEKERKEIWGKSARMKYFFPQSHH